MFFNISIKYVYWCKNIYSITASEDTNLNSIYSIFNTNKEIGININKVTIPTTIVGNYDPSKDRQYLNYYTSKVSIIIKDIKNKKLKNVGIYYSDNSIIEFAYLVKALKTQNFNGIILASNDIYSSVNNIQLMSIINTNKVFFQNVYMNTGGLTKFLTGNLDNQYKALSGKKSSDSLYGVQAYDATNMLISAIKNHYNTKTNPSFVKKNLHSITFTGTNGRITFNTDGSLQVNTNKVIYKISNGTLI